MTGNHEFHGDVAATVALFEAGDVRWLRDRVVALQPGLVLAGVDDLGRLMRREGRPEAALAAVLETTPAAAATILLSHTPTAVEEAAAAGVDLMLSGHTHGGQLWPFGYLVRQVFPHLTGHFIVDGMNLIVSRGTGSWGPRMRLWHPGEILKVTLRQEAARRQVL